MGRWGVLAGQARLLPAPMDGVPYPQPLAGPEPQYVPWGVLLVRPIGHPPRPVPPRAADQRSRAYPTLLRVLRWGRYGHRGGPQTPEVGSLAGAPRGPFSSLPPFRCAVCGGWCPVSPGWGGGGGGGGVFAVPGCVACGRVAPSPGRGSPPVCVFVARCVRAWCLCWCVVRGLWCVVCGGGVLVGLWRVCGVVGPSPLLAEVPVCYSPPLLAGFRCLWCCAAPRHSWLGFRRRQWRVVCGVWCVVCGERWRCVGGVVAGVWCGWSLATPGRGSRVLLPATPGWVSLPVVVGGPRHSWLRSPGGGGVWWGCGWCVVCVVPRHSWRRFLCATPRHSWLGFTACGGVRFPATPGWGLLAVVVRGAWCVVCGVWCAAVVCWWGCGCGWSLATPGGGSCVLLPATPGWVSMPVAVGGPRHSWLRALGAVSRHSWLGFAGGGGVWWGCGWCVVWLVPRHSWRRFLCATPRHSWLGFAAGGGGRSPPLLAGVRWRRWCVVCGGGVLVVGPSPLLAEVPVCYSPPLLAGFRCRRWCAVSRHSWLGPAGGGGAWCVVCGVRRWCVGGVVGGVWCGWSLATPGGGSCVLLPATPGWVSLPEVVGGPRHSWLGSAGGGGVWCVAVVCWLLVPRHSWRRFLCATPRHSWLGFAAGGGGRSSPLLAGVRWRRCVAWSVPRHSWRRFLRATPCHPWLGFGACGGVWSPASPGWGLLAAVVCGVWCVVCGVWCVVCGVRWWCAGGVAAGVWCGSFLASPGGGSCVLLPATPGWVSLPAVVGVPRHSWRRVPGAVPRHSWLGFAVGGGAWCAVCGVRRVACGGGVCGGFVAGVVGPSPLLAEVPACYSPPLLAGFRCRWWCGVVVRWVCLPGALPLGPGVCVCAVWPFVLVWVAWGGGGSRSVWLSCVRVRVLAVCGWWGGVCHTLAGSRRRSSACFTRQKKRSCRCVAEMRDMCDA